MTARALMKAAASWSACALLAGCSAVGAPKPDAGFTAADRKFFKAAEAEVEAAAPARKQDSKESFLQMGQFYLEARRPALAERMFEKAIAADPKSVAAHAGLAKCHADAGRTEKAAEVLDKGFALDAKSPALWNEAAVLRAKTGDLEGAVEAAERAAAGAPSVPLYQENLGNLLAVSGRHQQAIEVYTKAFNRAEAHYRIGLVLRDKGDQAACEQHLKRALTESPDHAAARRTLASMQAGGPAGDGAIQRAAYETNDETDRNVQPAVRKPGRRPIRSTGAQWAR